MHPTIQKHLRIVNIFGVLVVSGILAGSVGLGVVPAIHKGHENIAEAQRLERQNRELDSLPPELNAVETSLKDPAGRLQAAEAQLPDAGAMDDFMQQLASVATKAGIQVDMITPSKDIKDVGGYKSLPVQIAGTGDWESCYHFLTGLRTMGRLTRLDSMQIDLNRDAHSVPSAHPICHITVDISTFMAR